MAARDVRYKMYLAMALLLETSPIVHYPTAFVVPPLGLQWLRVAAMGLIR